MTEGTFFSAASRLDGNLGWARWSLGADGVTGPEGSGARVFGQWVQKIGGKRGATLRLHTGVSSSEDIAQLAFRAGGLESVRGFDYGTERGQAFWALQSDVSPIKGAFHPVFFLDAGQAARPTDLGRSAVLVGGGVGFSLLDGLVRFDFSHPITPVRGGLRFDLLVRAIR